MNAAVTPKRRIFSEIAIPVAMAVLVTLYLFYIDEGYYNFNWMANAGNWLAFVVYVGLITGIQLLLALVFLRRFSGWGKGLLSSLLGAVLVLILVFVLFS